MSVMVNHPHSYSPLVTVQTQQNQSDAKSSTKTPPSYDGVASPHTAHNQSDIKSPNKHSSLRSASADETSPLLSINNTDKKVHVHTARNWKSIFSESCASGILTGVIIGTCAGAIFGPGGILLGAAVGGFTGMAATAVSAYLHNDSKIVEDIPEPPPALIDYSPDMDTQLPEHNDIVEQFDYS